MANCGKDILLLREGTSQDERFIHALNPESVALNEFTLKEWLKFAWRFAKHLNYFDENNTSTPNGNWQDFFKSDSEIESFLQNIENGENITPHLALFVSFIQLLEFSKNQFNQITRRHLDFYYRNILKIEKLPATTDKVHLIFELAKNSMSEKIAAKTEFEGGKDENGNKRIYQTTEEIIVNAAKVSQVKNVINHHGTKKILAAPMANSPDGNGADWEGDNKSWWPFGYVDDKNYPDLPAAKIGFSLASKTLELAEGERNVSVEIKFKNPIKTISKHHENYLQVYCSGEKSWLGPFQISIENIVTKSTNTELPFNKLTNPKTEKIKKVKLPTRFDFIDSTTQKNVTGFTIKFVIPRYEKAVVNYNHDVLGENFSTELPVCRFLLKTEKTEAHNFYRQIIDAEIEMLAVEVNVNEAENLQLENDFAKLNPKKPFYPFGTQPVKNSRFTFGYPEIFKKKRKNIKENI